MFNLVIYEICIFRAGTGQFLNSLQQFVSITRRIVSEKIIKLILKLKLGKL